MEAKLAKYKEQLGQVTAILEKDPGNSELLSLKQDLEQAIELASQQLDPTTAPAEHTPVTQPAAAATTATTEPTSAPAAQSNTSAAVAANPASGQQKETGGIDASLLVPNTRVQVLWKNSRLWHNAIILDITDTGLYKVTICGYAQTAVVEKSHIRMYAKDKRKPLEVGTQCLAVYSEDNRWYNARIDDVYPGDGGYQVTFTDYGNSEQRDGFFIAVQNDLQTQSSRSAQASGDAMAIPAGFQLTDEQRRAKRKRKQAANYKAKQAKIAEETRQVQTSWQSFTSKARKGGKAGIRKKASIFQSPDTVDGKVGVVGSGHGVTENKDRGKHLF